MINFCSSRRCDSVPVAVGLRRGFDHAAVAYRHPVERLTIPVAAKGSEEEVAVAIMAGSALGLERLMAGRE
jgi:hypothetical protein